MMGTHASILLVNKRSGLTSFSSLNAIKRTVDPKVGHAGTLDKFAEGLLVVLTGSMTKLNVLFSTMDKSYRATIRFGSETDTLDPEGEVIAHSEIPLLDTIISTIPTFLGEIMQAPPLYSALHIQGKRASDIARSGKQVEMAERPVTVYDFSLISYEQGVLVADIHVSKGTYIRSLARDLGLACGSRAYLEALQRTSIGPFSLAESVDANDKDALLDAMRHTDAYLARVPSVSILEVPDDQLFRLANGSFPTSLREVRHSNQEVYGALYSRDGVLRAVADMQKGQLIAQVHPYQRGRGE